jgi:hypothetical protein
MVDISSPRRLACLSCHDQDRFGGLARPRASAEVGERDRRGTQHRPRPSTVSPLCRSRGPLRRRIAEVAATRHDSRWQRRGLTDPDGGPRNAIQTQAAWVSKDACPFVCTPSATQGFGSSGLSSAIASLSGAKPILGRARAGRAHPERWPGHDTSMRAPPRLGLDSTRHRPAVVRTIASAIASPSP